MDSKPITVLPDVTNKPIRLYAKCYYDFLDCDILSGDEKILYMCFKRFINLGNDNEGCREENVFPSIQRIKRMTGWGNDRVNKGIKSLIKKGLISKKRNGLGKNNTYYITDKEDMFKAHTVEEMVELAQENEIDMYIRKIREAGYDVQISKPKELSTAPAKVTEESPHSSEKDDNTDNKKMQPQRLHVCNLSYDDVKKYYEYEALATDFEGQTEYLDLLETVMNILFDLLNTSKATIRVNKEDKPKDVVIARLRKLQMCHIRHVIETYAKIEEPIPSEKAYIATMLYNAIDNYNHWVREAYKKYSGSV